MKTLEEVRKEKSEEERSSLSAMKEMRDTLDSVIETQDRKEKRYFWAALAGYDSETLIKMWHDKHNKEKIDLAELLKEYEKND